MVKKRKKQQNLAKFDFHSSFIKKNFIKFGKVLFTQAFCFELFWGDGFNIENVNSVHSLLFVFEIKICELIPWFWVFVSELRERDYNVKRHRGRRRFYEGYGIIQLE